jgi:glycerate 2-kinase
MHYLKTLPWNEINAMTPPFTNDSATRLLSAMFDAAVASAQPELRVPQFLPTTPPKGRLIVIGAGKASAAMARAVEMHWPGDLSGIVVTRYGYEEPCQRITILSAAHPVPDAAGHEAAQRIVNCVSDLTPDDLVLCLISGGASSLLPLPAEGLTLDDKQRINKDLLRSGATIREMNCVRRHLSGIKGGRLAAACYPAQVINLLISDVPGDDPADIGSGPTVGDATTCADALTIIDRYKITIPDAIRERLRDGGLESVKPGDQRLARVTTHMIAAPYQSLQAAADISLRAGIATYILGDAIEGEAKDVGTAFAGLARQIAAHNAPFQKPCILLSGGETTVTVRGHGKGGRNVEFLLALGIALQGAAGVYALAADTDGVDGLEEIAGAVWTPDTQNRAWSLNLSAREALDNNDAHTFFGKLDQSLVTGPTKTNVNDFRAILIV